jgi:hypothetical protein
LNEKDTPEIDMRIHGGNCEKGASASWEFYCSV